MMATPLVSFCCGIEGRGCCRELLSDLLEVRTNLWAEEEEYSAAIFLRDFYTCVQFCFKMETRSFAPSNDRPGRCCRQFYDG